MTTTYERSEELKKDCETLQIDDDKLESLSVQEVKTQYHKMSKVVHPDKADPTNPKQVEDFTAAFQELGNCYQRVLKYIVEKLQSKKEDTIEPMGDEEIFARDNFGKFNFPFENQGSFTVNVEDNLAEVWQECLEHFYGEPRISRNANGTECDRMWKTIFKQEEKKTEITVHFYNHNKPKDKKQSKILVQGAIQSLICEFVFCELPKIYKLVSSRKVLSLAPLRYPKRKRLTTPLKKRNIRYKPAAKPDVRHCAFCDFKSVSNVKVIRHMKTLHTEPCLTTPLLVEDMSLVSDDDEVSGKETEKLLDERSKCVDCDFLASNESELENHLGKCNKSKKSSNLNEDAVVPPIVKPQPLYKCNKCSFTTTDTANLTEHKKNSHEKEEEETVFLHTCISCDFKTNEYSKLLEHSENNHKPVPHTTQSQIFYNCDFCDFKSVSLDDCKVHIDSTHCETQKTICNLCDFRTASFSHMKEHVELSHCPKNSVLMLKTLTELTSVVRTLAQDIHQIKADSIIINNDMMSAIKGNIIEDIKDNVNIKFDIVEQ